MESTWFTYINRYPSIWIIYRKQVERERERDWIRQSQKIRKWKEWVCKGEHDVHVEAEGVRSWKYYYLLFVLFIDIWNMWEYGELWESMTSLNPITASSSSVTFFFVYFNNKNFSLTKAIYSFTMRINQSCYHLNFLKVFIWIKRYIFK